MGTDNFAKRRTNNNMLKGKMISLEMFGDYNIFNPVCQKQIITGIAYLPRNGIESLYLLNCI